MICSRTLGEIKIWRFYTDIFTASGCDKRCHLPTGLRVQRLKETNSLREKAALWFKYTYKYIYVRTDGEQRSRICFGDWAPKAAQSRSEPEHSSDPVLYNLRERRINRGPPGKPLSSRSAKRLQCQQISSTQLVPNGAGWHTHTHTHTHKFKHQQHSHPTRL